MGLLWVVATPIGNLADITLRALEALKSADLIACEDTRHCGKLLSHYGIQKQLLPYHAHAAQQESNRILVALSQGKKVAYCTDAGTPGVSDPGARLVQLARQAGHQVQPLPGPSAFATLISASGIGGKTFLFDGFLSTKATKRYSRVHALMSADFSFVLYEAPHRIEDLLALITRIDKDRVLCIGREMTKIHEEFIIGRAEECLAELKARGVPKGEFSVLVKKRDFN